LDCGPLEDRNKYLVRRLLGLKKNHEDYILAIVGAGHIDGMYKLLEKKLRNNQTSFSHKFIVELE